MFVHGGAGRGQNSRSDWLVHLTFKLKSTNHICHRQPGLLCDCMVQWNATMQKDGGFFLDGAYVQSGLVASSLAHIALRSTEGADWFESAISILI